MSSTHLAGALFTFAALASCSSEPAHPAPPAAPTHAATSSSSASNTHPSAIASTSASAPAIASSASSNTPGAKIVLLRDFSGPLDDPSVDSKVAASEADVVLRDLFPKYLDSDKKCPKSAGSLSLEQQRSQGFIVPRVTAKARGQLIDKGADDLVFVVFVGECVATHADNFGTEIMVVRRAGKQIASYPIAGGTTLVAARDVTGAGRTELLLTSGFTNQGITEIHASLVRLGAKTIDTIVDLGKVYEDNCGSGMTGSQTVSSRVSLNLSGPKVTPVLETSTRKCP